MHFTFDHPAALLLLLLLPCFYLCRKSAKSLYLPKLEWLPRRSRLLSTELWYRVAIFTLGTVALAAPFLYSAKQPAHREGVAIVLALDASGSMAESGFGSGDESRFALLQRIAKDFIEKRAGDNIGIVVFGSFAFAASPISYDIDGVKSILDTLEVEIAGKNTAIGEALAQSIRLFDHSGAKEKVIVLVTDGRNNSGAISPRMAVDEAKKRGIKIYTIGLGKRGDYDAALLDLIAQHSGGKAFAADNTDKLQQVYDEIDALLPSPLRSHHFLQKRELYFYPLALAIALLFLYIYRRRVI